MKWRTYQEHTAEFFRTLGYKADVEVQVTGIRAVHKIDVLVTFKKNSFNCMWVVECKDWERPVSKEKVMALYAITADIGADKGLLLSSAGFQSGAFNAAERTNIMLTSLDNLRTTHETDLHEAFVDGLQKKLDGMEKQLRAVFPREKLPTDQPGLTVHVGGPKLPIEARLGLVNYGLNRLRKKSFPIPVDYNGKGNYRQFATSIDEFLTGMEANMKILEGSLPNPNREHLEA